MGVVGVLRARLRTTLPPGGSLGLWGLQGREMSRDLYLPRTCLFRGIATEEKRSILKPCQNAPFSAVSGPSWGRLLELLAALVLLERV